MPLDALINPFPDLDAHYPPSPGDLLPRNNPPQHDFPYAPRRGEREAQVGPGKAEK